MACDFIKFRRIMTRLDAQLIKKEPERKAEKDNTKKKEKK